MKMDRMTRRNFLELGSLAIGMLGVGSVVGCSKIVQEPEKDAQWQPLPYTQLDSELTRRRGYEGYYRYHS